MNALVLGCGRVGAGVALELAARGVDVAVVDHDPAALQLPGARPPATRVLGSILDRQVLLEAGIDGADAVAVVTGDDASNAVVALAARRRFAVPAVVARIYDPRLADVQQRLGVRTVAPVRWGIQRISDLVTATAVTHVTTLGSGGVEVVEVLVPQLLHGRPVGELEVLGELHVVAISRGRRSVLPTVGDTLHGGDVVHVAVGPGALGRLEALLGEG